MDVMESLSVQVNRHIRDTNLNVSEYCKREECWNKLKGIGFRMPLEIEAEYISDNGREDFTTRPTDIDSAVEFCVNQGFQAWYDLST